MYDYQAKQIESISNLIFKLNTDLAISYYLSQINANEGGKKVPHTDTVRNRQNDYYFKHMMFLKGRKFFF